MKNLFLILVATFFYTVQALDHTEELPQDLYTIDETIVVVSHPYGRVPILLSDLRLGIDGKMPTLKDLILEHLITSDAVNGLKVKLPEDYVDRLLTHLQKANNLPREKLFEAFKVELGYSEAEVKYRLHKRQLIETAYEYRIKADKKLIIQDLEIKAWAQEHPQEVEAYNQAHPDYQAAAYTLTQAYIPSIKDSLVDKTVIENMDREGKITWEEPFTVKETQLPEDKLPLMENPEGSIISIELLDDGIEVTKLTQKTERKNVPFEALSKLIAARIRQERQQEITKAYHQKLLSEAKLIYTNDTWRDMVEQSSNN